MMLTQCEAPNPILQLRLTEMETRESILEHLKDMAEGKLWRNSGYSSLQKYCESELGYSTTESKELLTQIGEIIPSNKLVSNDPVIQFRLDILRNWRKEKSRSLEVRAFQILSNRTLLELAERAPKNVQELMFIFGIGEKKCEAYGAEIIALLNS